MARIAEVIVAVAFILGGLTLGVIERDGLDSKIAAYFPLLSPSLRVALGATATALQVLVGLALLTRPSTRTSVAASLLLGAMTLLLVSRGANEGWGARCQCLTGLFDQSVLGGLVRNGILIVMTVWSHKANRRRSHEGMTYD